MSKFRIIAYYTKDTGYEDEAVKFISCLEKIKKENNELKYYVEEVKNLGNWQLNTRYKATFIKNMLHKFPDIPLVYLDIDSRVLSYPILFDDMSCADKVFDIGVFYLVHKANGRRELVNNTIYIENNKKTIKLIDEWVRLNDVTTTNLEQANLQKIIDSKFIPDLSVYSLPPRYAQINITMDKLGKPVIKQMQASRRLRRNILIRNDNIA